MVYVLFVLVSAFAAQASGQTVRGGEVRGVVVDPEGAAISNAPIGLRHADSRAVAADAKTDGLGQFRIGMLNAGSYTINIRLQGWRSRTVDSIDVRGGETTNLGSIHLSLAGCDAPGANCDVFSNDRKDFPSRPLYQGYLKGNLSCEVDLRHGKVNCPAGAVAARRARQTDFKIVKENEQIYLSPLNGTAMSSPNSSKADCSDAQFREAKIVVDDLGLGDDICVRTHEGHLCHAFLTSNVEPTSSEIRLWIVTRRR